MCGPHLFSADPPLSFMHLSFLTQKVAFTPRCHVVQMVLGFVCGNDGVMADLENVGDLLLVFDSVLSGDRQHGSAFSFVRDYEDRTMHLIHARAVVHVPQLVLGDKVSVLRDPASAQSQVWSTVFSRTR